MTWLSRIALIALVAGSLGACCTPGHWGRADSRGSLAYAWETLSRHHRGDVESTRRMLGNLPDTISALDDDAAEKIGNTCRLYFTGSMNEK